MSELVERAKELAYRAHAGQVDKAGRPYIEHVARVAASAREPGHLNCPGCDEAEAVGWLHDVLEDSPTYGRHVSEFPQRIHFAVLELTRGVESDDLYYLYIRNDKLALRVKLADIADNSNEERLALLDSETAERLRKKYRKALEALGVSDDGRG